MTLWEYNSYMQGQELVQKQQTAACILTGYYAAYYVGGGKKAKNPNDLIGRLYAKKQSFEEGLMEIQRIKEMERGGKDVRG